MLTVNQIYEGLERVTKRDGLLYQERCWRHGHNGGNTPATVMLYGKPECKEHALLELEE